jgi:hypothetical protein
MDDYQAGGYLLTDQTKTALKKAAADIGKRNGLPHVYFTHQFGKRRHFISGHGKATFTQTHHRDITENIALSWQGTMTEENFLSALRPFTELLHQAEQELAQP